MHPALKVGIGTLTIGTIAGAGYASSYYLGSSTEEGILITELVNSKYEYKLLDTEVGKNGPDKFYWNKNWDNYKKDNANKPTGKDTFQLAGWTQGFNGDLIDLFVAKCAYLKSSKYKGDSPPLYSDLTKYCGRGIMLEEQAKKDNLTILNPDIEDAVWETKKDKITPELKKHIKFLESEGQQVNTNLIKQSCKDFAKKTKQEKDYSEIYKYYREICTNPSTERNS